MEEIELNLDFCDECRSRAKKLKIRRAESLKEIDK